MLASTRARRDLDKAGRTESHRKGCGSARFPHFFAMPERIQKPVEPVPWGRNRVTAVGRARPIFRARTRRICSKNAQGRSESIEALPAAHRPINGRQTGARFRSGAVIFPSLLRRQGLLAPAAQIGPMNTRAGNCADGIDHNFSVQIFRRRAGRGRSASDFREHCRLRSSRQSAGD